MAIKVLRAGSVVTFFNRFNNDDLRVIAGAGVHFKNTIVEKETEKDRERAWERLYFTDCLRVQTQGRRMWYMATAADTKSRGWGDRRMHGVSKGLEGGWVEETLQTGWICHFSGCHCHLYSHLRMYRERGEEGIMTLFLEGTGRGHEEEEERPRRDDE